MDSESTNYRTDINGLRGLAVIAVVIFHTAQGIATGGYVGVDIFFVLSGFLISNSIQTSISRKKFNLYSFYEGRVLRILPSALTVAALVAVTSSWTLFPEEKKEIYEAIIYFLKLQSNVWAPESISYFGIDTEYKPLIHYWSLSIELQFYIITPIILFILLKNQQAKILLATCSTILLSSFIYASLVVGEDPNQGYFSSLMRVWEFSLGVLLSLIGVNSLKEKLAPNQRNLLVGLGIALILIAIITLDENSNIPGLYALIPCFGVILIITYGDRKLFFSKLLSVRLLTLTGTISFSLYLIHQPIFAFYRLILGRNFTEFEVFIALIVSILASIFLYITVENPCKNKKYPQKILAILYITFITSFLLFYSFNMKKASENIEDLDPEVKHYLNFRYDNNPRLAECRISNKIIEPADSCLYGNNTNKKIALWGDSHADQLVTPIAKELNSRGYSIIEFSVTGCPPIINVESITSNKKCSENSKKILEYIMSNDAIHQVVLHAYWIGYIDEKLIIHTQKSKNIFDSFNDTIKNLTNSGKKVHIIYPVPKMNVNPPLYLARRSLIGYGFSNNTVSLSKKDFEEQSKYAVTLLDDVVTNHDLNAIHISNMLLDPTTSQYLGVYNNNVLYRDDNHLSQFGAEKVSKSIVNLILK